MTFVATSPDFVAALHGYQPLVRRVCRLYCQAADDRQDLFQEIMLQLWRAWPRYVPQANTKLSTWLYRIALNVAISNLRQRTRRPTAVSLEEEAWHLAQHSEGGAYEPAETAALYCAINQLSAVDRAFVLLYLKDRAYEEMADILSITQNNVRVKMPRVQEKLRRLLLPVH